MAKIMLVVGHSLLSTTAYYVQSKVHSRSIKREKIKMENNIRYAVSIDSTQSFDDPNCREYSISAISNCSSRSRRIKSDFMFHPILPNTTSNIETDGMH